MRKVTELATGQVKDEWIYLGGFEIYRKHGAKPLVRETLHVMDDKQRIALVETRIKGDDGSPARLIRYQFGNHLGSASLELDDNAKVISYEEYYPYGSTSYQAVNRDIRAAAKRYRYTGKERDEETGFNYHGARYYAVWLGRWVSADPAGLSDGPNRYEYVRANPIANADRNGRETSRAENELFTALRLSQQVNAETPVRFALVLAENADKYDPILAKYGYRGITSWRSGESAEDKAADAQRYFNRAFQAWYQAGGSEYLHTSVIGGGGRYGDFYQGTPQRNAIEALGRSVQRSEAVGHAIAGANLAFGGHWFRSIPNAWDGEDFCQG
jgi:RHS repeat-associated protein